MKKDKQTYSTPLTNEDEDIYVLLFNAIQNSNIRMINLIVEERPYDVIKLEDDTKMTSKNNILILVLHKSTYLNLTLISSTIIEILKKHLKKEELTNFINKKCSSGYSVIHYASYRGNIDLVELFIENGADYLLKSPRGLNVLHLAAQGDKPESLVYFKDKYNMDILEKDFNGSTPLHWACFMGSDHALNFLLAWTDDVNVKENLGYTPLHLAVYSERTKIVKKLFYKGADITAVDNEGRSPLQLAIQKKKQNIVDMLSDKKLLEKLFFVPQLIKAESSYFNVTLFFILHISAHIICLFVLLPSKYFLKIVLDFYALYFIYGIYELLVYFLFFKMLFSDPGILNSNKNESLLKLVEKRAKIEDYCPSCKVKMRVYTKHCHYCKRCIEDFDHHCVWVNNCVGKNNINIFIFFLVIVFLNLVFHFLIGYSVFHLDQNSKIIFPLNIHFLYSNRVRDYFAGFIMVISVLFSIPTSLIIFFQISNKIRRRNKVISSNTTVFPPTHNDDLKDKLLKIN